LSFWTQLRSGGGNDADIRTLQASQERIEAESSIENTDELTMGRVDYDGIGFGMDPDDQTAELFGYAGQPDGDGADTDGLGLGADARDGSSLEPMGFRMCGGDATTYTVADSPAGELAKTGDKVDGIFGDGMTPWIFGYSQARKV
jgi:hypothetical protein